MRAKLGTKPLYRDPMPSSRTMWTTYDTKPFCVAPRSVMIRVPTTSAGDPTHVAAKPARRDWNWRALCLDFMVSQSCGDDDGLPMTQTHGEYRRLASGQALWLQGVFDLSPDVRC